MYALGIVVAIVCFLYLSLLALLRAGRERRKQQGSGYKELPQVSQEVIETLEAQATGEDWGKSNQAGRNYCTELRKEQPALFTLLVEILKQSGADDLRGLASGIIVYTLLKAQIEVDLLDKSLRQSHH